MTTDPETGEITGRCNAIANSGLPCGSRAMSNSDKCLMHSTDPAHVALREQGRSLAGRKPILRDLSGLPAGIQDAAAVTQALNALFVELAKGDATDKNVSSILKVLTAQLRALELTDIDRRLKELEGV